MQSETEKAIRQISKELAKLNNIIAIIGHAMTGKKITQLKQSKKDFEKIVEQRKGVT